MLESLLLRLVHTLQRPDGENMIAFHCHKLCSCDTCAPVRLIIERLDGQNEPTSRIGTRSEYAAQDALCDPAKLAELMVLALRARGFDVGPFAVRGGTTIQIWASNFGTIVVETNGPDYSHTSLTMLQTRAKLLAIMQTPPDESSRDACEQILKGEP